MVVKGYSWEPGMNPTKKKGHTHTNKITNLTLSTTGWRNRTKTWNELKRQWIPRFRSSQDSKNKHANEKLPGEVPYEMRASKNA